MQPQRESRPGAAPAGGARSALDTLTQPRVALAILVLLTLALRLPSLWIPILDIDESQFAGFAHVLMDGGRPYIDSLDTKPPGIYLFYQALFTAFGRTNMGAVHAALILINILTAWTLFAVGRRLGRPHAGLVAALLFAVFSTTSAPKITSANIASILALPLTVSVWLLLRIRGRSPADLLRAAAAGLAVGLACAFKYQAGMHIPLALVWLLVTCGRRAVWPAVAFLLPIGGVAAAVWGYLVAHDAAEAFWNWSFLGSLHYLGLGEQNLPWVVSLVVRGGRYLAPSAPVWLLALAFVWQRVRASWRQRTAPARAADDLPVRTQWLLILWLGLNFVATSAGGRFYPHYFLQSLPPAALLAGLQFERLWPGWFAPRRWARRAAVGVLLLAAALGAVPRYAYGWFQDAFPDDDPRSYAPIVAYLEAHSRPTDRIFVWGFATPIYFFSERPPASRFLWADLMTGRAPGPNRAEAREIDTTRYARPDAWQAFMADLERHRPLYIIDTSPGNFHGYGRYPIEDFSIIRNYLRAHYVREAAAHGVVYYRRVAPAAP